jgi:hypothetical protein
MKIAICFEKPKHVYYTKISLGKHAIAASTYVSEFLRFLWSWILITESKKMVKICRKVREKYRVTQAAHFRGIVLQQV